MFRLISFLNIECGKKFSRHKKMRSHGKYWRGMEFFPLCTLYSCQLTIGVERQHQKRIARGGGHCPSGIYPEKILPINHDCIINIEFELY